jgi:dTDP-4-amino-4,6-dideoxygalactose transaminase
VPDECQHAYRNYVIRVEERDEVRVSLAREGIHTDILYVPPIHLHTAFQERGYGPGDLPITEMLAQELLCLPMFPELSDEQVQYVGQSLAQTVSGSGAPEW